MVVGDLDHALRTQRRERQVLARAPARHRTRHPLAGGVLPPGPRVRVRVRRARLDDERRELLDQRGAPRRRERRGDADELELARVVVQAEQGRAEQRHRGGRRLVQAVPREHDVRLAAVLDLEHRALVRLVRAVERLGDDAVQARPLERVEPLPRHGDVARAGRGVHGRAVEAQGVEHLLPPRERRAREVLVPQREHVEHDEGRGGLLREQAHARRRRVDALLEHLELEAAVPRDDDLAVDHAPGRQSGPHRLDDLGEIAVHGPRVPAVEPHLVAVAVHDRAEAVPLRLVHVPAVDGVGLGHGGHGLREHGQHGGHDGQVHVPMLPPGLPPCAAWWPRSACDPRAQAGSCAVSAAFVPVMR